MSETPSALTINEFQDGLSTLLRGAVAGAITSIDVLTKPGHVPEIIVRSHETDVIHEYRFTLPLDKRYLLSV